ncbi:hypothetical protein FA13DRAFT_1646742, partial [Coprinellus micaceus]
MPQANIHSIPPEILGAVFVSAGEVSSSFRPAVAISHVCRLWREIILSTPAAWTHLNLSGP